MIRNVKASDAHQSARQFTSWQNHSAESSRRSTPTFHRCATQPPIVRRSHLPSSSNCASQPKLQLPPSGRLKQNAIRSKNELINSVSDTVSSPIDFLSDSYIKHLILLLDTNNQNNAVCTRGRQYVEDLFPSTESGKSVLRSEISSSTSSSTSSSSPSSSSDHDDHYSQSEDNSSTESGRFAPCYAIQKDNLAQLTQRLYLKQQQIKSLTSERLNQRSRLETLKLEHKRLTETVLKLRQQTDCYTYGNVHKTDLKDISNDLKKKALQLEEAGKHQQQVITERESKLMEAQQNVKQNQLWVDQLVTEVNSVKQLLVSREQQLNTLLSTHAREIDKDLRLKLLHNELMEQRGNIRVLVRFQPSKKCIVKYTADDTAVLKLSSLEKKAFQFNRIFPPPTKQSEVFEEVEPLLTSFLDGYNVCVTAYGQTGSGKTFTMQGSAASPGIISRALRHVLHLCSRRLLWQYKLSVSVLQIYNENITDLLTDDLKRISIQDNGHNVLLKHLTEADVTSEEDIVEYMKLGLKRRITSKTHANLMSSRSHFVVMLHARGSCTVQQCHSDSVLTLCDLAGFERATEPCQSTVFQESKYIGKSLAVLGRVFDSLKKKDKMVPYRDSRLTHLLKPSLSGQSKFCLILTASESAECLSATLRTLQLGQQAATICLGRAKQNVKYMK